MKFYNDILIEQCHDMPFWQYHHHLDNLSHLTFNSFALIWVCFRKKTPCTFPKTSYSSRTICDILIFASISDHRRELSTKSLMMTRPTIQLPQQTIDQTFLLFQIIAFLPTFIWSKQPINVFVGLKAFDFTRLWGPNLWSSLFK